jgi:hypothetical protein
LSKKQLRRPKGFLLRHSIMFMQKAKDWGIEHRSLRCFGGSLKALVKLDYVYLESVVTASRQAAPRV